MGYFYKAIVQAVLLYGAEIWVLLEHMLHILNLFHHQYAHYIDHEYVHQDLDDTWVTPHSSMVLEKCGLFSIAEYICYCKQTVMNFVTG